MLIVKKTTSGDYRSARGSAKAASVCDRVEPLTCDVLNDLIHKQIESELSTHDSEQQYFS